MKAAQNTWTRRLDRVLNDASSTPKRRLDLFLSVLVVISVGLLLQTGSLHAHNDVALWVRVLDTAILVFFALEYLARLLFIRADPPKFVKISPLPKLRYEVGARVAWMLSPLAIIDASHPTCPAKRSPADFTSLTAAWWSA